MIIRSSYLNANKALADLLVRKPEPKGQRTQYGWSERWIVLDGSLRTVYDSGEFRFSGLQFSHSLKVNRYRGPFRVYLHTYYRASALWSAFQAVRRVYRGVPPSSPKGDDSEGILDISGSSPNSVSSRISARRAVGQQISLRSGRMKGSRNASSPRPSPENTNKSFKKVFESDLTHGNPSVNEDSYINFLRSWSGSRTPGFRRLKKREYPINGHHVSVFTISENRLLEYTYFRDNFPPGRDMYSMTLDAYTLHYNPPAGPVHSALARSRALSRLVEKANVQIEANLAQDFAQIGQTVRLIGNTLSRLTGSLRHLRRGKLLDASRALFAPRAPRYGLNGGPAASKNLAENWLELQYGWKPLLMDIHGSMNALAKLNLAESMIKQVTASATCWDVDDYFQPLFQANPPRVIPAGWTRTKSTCRFGLRFRVEDEFIAFMAQTGFTNPINLVWEVIPLSFVADWFLPIGPWLETLSAWDGLSFVDGYESRFTKQEVVSAIDVNEGPGFQNGSDEFIVRGDYIREWVEFDRVKLTTFPIQNPPSFKNPFSTAHILNGIALLKALTS